MNLPAIRRRSKVEERDAFPAMTINDWLTMFQWNGLSYLPGMTPSLAGPSEEIGQNFQGYVQQAYKSNGVVFACMLVRMLLFSEARFQFRQVRKGRPGDLFGSTELAVLEKPWPNGTTGDLLTRMIQDVDLAGNFFGLRQGNRLRRLRPDWVDIILGTSADPREIETTPAGQVLEGSLDMELVGYAYWPGGKRKGGKMEALSVEQVAHFAPIPDPVASYRGMSWLTPVVREIMADSGMTNHKQKFLDNGATPSMVGILPISNQQDFDRWVDKFRERQEGVQNAYKTLFLGPGADMKVVGANFHEIDFAVTQGHGETRVAAAAGVPPVIVGLSEGLQAATYSNYGQARRRFADGTIRPLWRNAAASLETIINVPSQAQLWYDDRDIPFVVEDGKDAALMLHSRSAAISTLVTAGFMPATVVAAVVADDLTRLVHSGLFSVQLQPAGTVVLAPDAPQPNVEGFTPFDPQTGEPRTTDGYLVAQLEGSLVANGAATSRAEAARLLSPFLEGEQGGDDQ